MQYHNSKGAPPEQDNGFSIAPASSLQRQFWLINQWQPEGSAYNISTVFKLIGKIDVEALQDSINEIVQQHEVFRTNIVNNSDALEQRIAGKLTINIKIEDTNHTDLIKQKASIEQILEKETLSPFDLGKDQLMRVCLIKTDENTHVLSIVMHHAIIDLRTKELFLSELCARYNAKVEPSVSFDAKNNHNQYSDYAKRQQAWLKTESAEKLTRFWQAELKRFSGILNLPMDYPRPSNQTFHGDRKEIYLNKENTIRLRDFCKENTVDIFVVLLSAYLILLKRYSNQCDIIIGVPHSNRRHPDDKYTMGCFVNILPLAFDLTAPLSAIQVIRQVRMKMLESHRNQEAPFESIVNALKPKRDPSYNPIFQVGFTFEPDYNLALCHITTEILESFNKGAQIDLFLCFKRIEKDILGYLKFNTALFAPETIERLCSHYQIILKSIIENANQCLDLLPVLSNAEKEKILVEWNLTDQPFPNCCLHEMIERQAERTPDHVAAVFKDESITYKALNNRANQVAHYLMGQGVESGDFVGVHIERSLEMLIAVYGILKAGAAYIPLDVEFPEQRIVQMLEDATPKVIFTQKKLSDRICFAKSQVICLDNNWQYIREYKTEKPGVKIHPEDLAYVIFTSGSTGRAKGVMIPHRAVVNCLTSMQKDPGISSKDTLLAVTTLSFDISILELFLPLTAGAKIIIADSQTAQDGQALLSLIKSSGTTVFQATPTTYHLLFSAGWKTPLPLKVLCGGELFPYELAQKLLKLSNSVWNMYGPTETTIWSTCCQVSNNKPVSIGKPIANTKTYIVNSSNQPVPIGVTGELLISGAGVSRGYLKQPEITDNQFIQNIFEPSSQFKLYRTGDLACYLPSGEIRILGRIDHQIKIRGFRIELEDIENAIETHPAVKQAVAKSHEYTPGDTRLVAYVTVHDNGENIAFREYLKDLLPGYMIPGIITVLQKMPLTLNHKIDRKALPGPDRERPEQKRKLILPQNQAQEVLAEIWSEVLQLNQVGIDDGFFDLGGNSLLSILVITKLEQQLKVKIPVVKFYQYPTIRLFSEHLQQTETHGANENIRERVKMQRRVVAQTRKNIVHAKRNQV